MLLDSNTFTHSFIKVVFICRPLLCLCRPYLPAFLQVIAINVQDPLAELLNDIDDLHVHLPGCVEAIHSWLKHYKTPAVNTFAFDGKIQDRKFAEQVIEETHQEWRHLIEDRGKSATVAK